MNTTNTNQIQQVEYVENQKKCKYRIFNYKYRCMQCGDDILLSIGNKNQAVSPPNTDPHLYHHHHYCHHLHNRRHHHNYHHHCRPFWNILSLWSQSSHRSRRRSWILYFQELGQMEVYLILNRKARNIDFYRNLGIIRICFLESTYRGGRRTSLDASFARCFAIF